MTDADDTETNQPPPESPAEAIPALIAQASELWSLTCGYYGLPGELRRRGFHSLNMHSLATDWIRCLELLVRRIILIMALALDLPQRAPAASASGERPARPPAVKKPFHAPRRPFTIMPRVEAPRPHRGRRKPPSRPNTRGLARRLDQLFHAIRYPDPYARRTALALARIAQNPPPHDPDHPLIGLQPWLIRPELRSYGESTMYDQIERAQLLAQHCLDQWHARLPPARMPEPG